MKLPKNDWSIRITNVRDVFLNGQFYVVYSGTSFAEQRVVLALKIRTISVVHKEVTNLINILFRYSGIIIVKVSIM